jgi:SAM-dependent methyltransferase
VTRKNVEWQIPVNINKMRCRRANLDSMEKWDLESQRNFWNEWDMHYLQSDTLGRQAIRRGQVVLDLIRSLGMRQPSILEVGCGNGWLAERLQEFGPVLGVDLSNAAIEEARRRVPMGRFESGDILHADLPAASFDIVVSLETLSHVLDQERFLEIAAEALKKEGYLIIATQNRTVYTRRRDVCPPPPGELRHWLTRHELLILLQRRFKPLRVFTIEPSGDMGFLRVANSRILNSIFIKVIPQDTIQSLKERIGIGQTIVALAVKCL